MTRSYDFAVAGVIAIISVIIHRMGVELFAPESALHNVASSGTATMQGAARADLWFQILSIWVPLLGLGFAFCYLVIKEYRRQVTTAVRPG